MTNSTFGYPTQYQTESIEIDGKSVTGLFMAISIYENIFSPVITGNITIFETDSNRFIEANEIEFIGILCY